MQSKLNSQYIAGKSAKRVIRLGKQFDFFNNVKYLPYDPSILHLDIYSIEIKHMFTQRPICRCL